MPYCSSECSAGLDFQAIFPKNDKTVSVPLYQDHSKNAQFALVWVKIQVTVQDKNRAIVISNKDSLEQKVKIFIQENHITHLSKDPTNTYQKQIQQVLQKCDTLVEKGRHKYLMNIKPTAPMLNVYIKMHMEDKPIRPMINNTHAPS
jgi:hypothetical protein